MIVKCIYFKSSGKYYTEGSINVDDSVINEFIYPRAIGKRLNELKMLPGLNSGEWKHSFVCYPEDLYPELIQN